MDGEWQEMQKIINIINEIDYWFINNALQGFYRVLHFIQEHVVHYVSSRGLQWRRQCGQQVNPQFVKRSAERRHIVHYNGVFHFIS